MSRTVRREGLRGEVHRQRQAAQREWARFPHLKRLLQDHAPSLWHEVRRCRMGNVRLWEDHNRGGLYRVQPYACHVLPWCIQCVRAEHRRRVLQALNEFHRCTPAGHEPRFIHIVQTAPVYHDGHNFGPHSGWGVEASRNVPMFRRIVMEALEDAYGPGIGAIMSYQDFGERCFAKRHPHQDLTLNGWRLVDGRPDEVLRIDLQGAALQRWHDCIVRGATRLRIDASIGKVDFQPMVVGAAAYQARLKYQTREMVDVRKIDNYDRTRQTLDWMAYDKPVRERFNVLDFMAGLAEYQYRLGVFGADQPRQLHVSMGHMAKGRIHRTEKAMGGSDMPHARGCNCYACGEWDRADGGDEFGVAEISAR